MGEEKRAMPVPVRNKYVDFVSDEHFLECVRHVCDAYPSPSSAIDMKRLSRNGIDPIKMIFDMLSGRIDFKKWLQSEKVRQEDKTINNKIGEFHQMLLGGVKGWTDLGIGDDSHLDLRKNDGTIVIEIKNKHNTMNSSSTAKCREKLESSVNSNPRTTAYWAFIVSKNGSSGEAVWEYKGRINPRIKKIWGTNVYELVTGDPKALENTWKALESAIHDVLKDSSNINEKERKTLLGLFYAGFGICG